MTDIVESETHYFLYILPSEKARASNITPRTWNAEYKCWVYPRNAKMYDTLMSEFGDELSEIKITRPASLNTPVQTNNNVQNIADNITEQLESIHRKLSETNNTSPEVIQLREDKKENKREILSLRKKLSDANEKIDESEKKYQALLQESQEHKKVAEWSSSEDYVIQFIMQIATNIPEKNSSFLKSLLSNQKLDFELVKKVEAELRNILKTKLNIDDDFKTTDELIKISKGKEVSYAASDYAYAIKTQRNILFHGKEDNKEEQQGRIIYTLFAFVLMLKELNEAK